MHNIHIPALGTATQCPLVSVHFTLDTLSVQEFGIAAAERELF